MSLRAVQQMPILLRSLSHEQKTLGACEPTGWGPGVGTSTFRNTMVPQSDLLDIAIVTYTSSTAFDHICNILLPVGSVIGFHLRHTVI